MRLGAYLDLALQLGMDVKTAMLMEIRTVYEICEIRSRAQSEAIHRGNQRH